MVKTELIIMPERKKNPPTFMLKGMTDEQRKDFTESWHNATWLTDKIKKNIEQHIKLLVAALVDGEVPCVIYDVDYKNDDQLKSDIRAYTQLITFLP